jgi:hypothetical protein
MLRSRIIQEAPDRDDTLAGGQFKFVRRVTVQDPSVGSCRIYQIRRSNMVLRVDSYLNSSIGIYGELTAPNEIWRQCEILVDETSHYPVLVDTRIRSVRESHCENRHALLLARRR